MKTPLILLAAFAISSFAAPLEKIAQKQEFSMREVEKLLKRSMDNNTSFKIKDWSINYPKSYITFNGIDISAPKAKEKSSAGPRIKGSVQKVIADYLYFDHSKDNAYYSIRVENVGAVIDTTGEEKRKEPEQKIKIDNIHPPIDNIIKELFVTKVELLLRDLRKENELAVPLIVKDILIENLEVFPSGRNEKKYASVSAKGEVFGGTVSLKGNVNPFHIPKVLDIDLKVENVSIVKLNPYLKEFGGVDATSGKLSVYLESAVKGDIVEGYVKFVTEDAEMIKGWQEGQGFFKNLKENMMDLGLRLFNRKDDDDKVAGKIPFSGKVDDIKWEFWTLFETLLKSAVVEPLKGNIEKSVDLDDV
ncbi:MAG: hypothetical protein CME64_07605 [Halobacteriovoraceae bacterium]|nr:hypothetical protein [Halobacteriovoraceae bacterium]|tara:strand:- start:67051 stop:68133 length:1083 start_codon:yes stop_codon:yes gene_type:complete